ncbi:MAG TPA: CYTH and CHAD domain-containing protein [Actinomycetes bacterium]|nr:CYTH and CHAD domain-containing protein [Actinomycetes bacterium]
MSTPRHTETERKFRVHGLFRLPSLAASEGAAPLPGVADVREGGTLDLLAVYYDTADLRLARSRVSLRRREGGPDEGWHLKLPTEGLETREELWCPLSAGALPPEELTDVVRALTRGAALEEVAALRTTRVVHDLLDSEGAVLAELTDDSVSVLDGEHVAARFREIEVELGTGEVELLDAVGEVLGVAGAVPGGYVSKVGRALGPLATAPPDVAEPEPPGLDDPAGEVVRAHLARNVVALLAQDRRVRLDEPDSVHQMRVAARRIRSGLKTFAPLVEEGWAVALREQLAWVAGVLGGVRDREVLRERLLRHLAEVAESLPGLDTAPAAGLVDRTLADEAAAARAGVLEVMRSPRYLDLLDRLVDAANVPRLTEAAQEPARTALPPLLGRAWRRLSRRVAILAEADDDHHWHEARISAKQARYAAEALAPVFGKPARRFAEQLERVTELLGEHQDAAVAATTVRALASGRRVGGQVGFTLGLLHAAERRSIEDTRAEFRRVWPEVARRHHRAWLQP